MSASLEKISEANSDISLKKHFLDYFLFKHDGHGMPKSKGGFLLFYGVFVVLATVGLSLVNWGIISSDLRLELQDHLVQTSIFMIPFWLVVGLARPSAMFSICNLYLGFATTGVLGSILTQALGQSGAILSLGLTCWVIAAFLKFQGKD